MTVSAPLPSGGPFRRYTAPRSGAEARPATATCTKGQEGVGADVGDTVGACVGAAVGSSVGCAVGSLVGRAVGAAVGTAVGGGVGCGDGDGVGDNTDAFPRDKTETLDWDGDHVGNTADAFSLRWSFFGVGATLGFVFSAPLSIEGGRTSSQGQLQAEIVIVLVTMAAALIGLGLFECTSNMPQAGASQRKK